METEYKDNRCPGLNLGCEYASSSQIVSRCETKSYKFCPRFNDLNLASQRNLKVEKLEEGIIVIP